jgi:hypothetical protein
LAQTNTKGGSKFRGHVTPLEHTANRRQLLEQYCRLDTAAMLMIWRHWRGARAIG